MKLAAKIYLGMTASSLLLLSLLNSCVKNRNDLATDFTQIQPIIELSQAGFQALVYAPVTTPQEVRIYINYAAPTPAPKDIVVTIAKDPSAIAAYNTANGSNYSFVPDSTYSVPTYQVTIKAGTNLAYIPIQVYPNKVNLSAENAIAFKIVDSQGYKVSANATSVVYGILVKNQWDGLYRFKGFMNHPSPANTGPFNYDAWEVVTSGQFTDYFFQGVGNNLGYFGNVQPNMQIDPVTNKVVLRNDGPANGVVICCEDPTNRYDPAKQTFYISAGYSAGTRTFKDTLIYERPR